jgi:hypothetical protein
VNEPAPRRRLSDRDARRLSVAVGLATLALGSWLCARPDPSPLLVAVTDLPPLPSAAPAAADLEAGPHPAASCDELMARDDPDDAPLLPLLCPGHELSLHRAKQVLLAADSIPAALALRPALAPHPELVAIVDLVAGQASGALPAGDFDPQSATVVPIDAEVVGWARRAELAIVDDAVDHDPRTRAGGLLAKIYLQAFVRLGVPADAALPPLARRVAAMAAYHGRRFCESYWRRRVSGLADLFGETERGLLSIVIAWEHTPPFGADALEVWEQEQTIAYVTRSGPASRLRAHDAPTQDTPPFEVGAGPRLERLVAHGLLDLAVDQAADLAGSGDPPVGLDTLEQLLQDAARRTDRPEALARIDERMEMLRGRSRPPTLTGAGVIAPAQWPWPSTNSVADVATQWWVMAEASEGFARRHAIGRALSCTATRPDAARQVLASAVASDAAPGLQAAREPLAEQLRAWEPDRRADLELELAGALAAPDEARRLAFALDLK